MILYKAYFTVVKNLIDIHFYTSHSNYMYTIYMCNNNYLPLINWSNFRRSVHALRVLKYNIIYYYVYLLRSCRYATTHKK